ncbi:hypothetical protein T4A_12951 [Trichinella pseudospiralis]|uniref:Uncharacterized protein n=1 Tax=Trichinella pseudospiralis TaxID=6337 RepID=A0A0V1DLT1_TRIPS|nr:hypothetical protein T4A_12951 [Trichinella pseudospiralis]
MHYTKQVQVLLRRYFIQIQVQALNYLAKNVQAADMVVYVQNNLWAVPQFF